MRVAIPVGGEDLVVYRRTGRAPFFAVFDIKEEDISLVEIRRNPHSEREDHHDEEEEDFEESVRLHERDLSVIDDCDYMIVSAVGKHFKEALRRKGIKVAKVSYGKGATAYDFIKEFLQGG